MAKPRPKNTKKDNGRRGKKKTSVLTIDKIDYVDYKDVRTLRQLIDRENRIMPRRRTGTSAIFQRAVRRAVLDLVGPDVP